MISGITDPEIEDMIIVVGAAQNTGKHSSWGKCKHTGYEVTAYSNRGSRVDVLAPGGEKTIDGIPDASIYSTVPYGNGYDGLVGTSMACPHVAGVAAMIFGIDPTFTAKEVKDIIISTATGSYGSVKEQYPLLNARLAVEKAIKLSNEKAKGQTGDDLPFEPSGEHQYRIFYDALTWEEAKAACEAKGGHLATITSEEEQQKLNLYNAGNHKLWIGGYKNTEGQWCWVTGEPWEYENWGDGEPNNSSNVVAGESCVAMWPEKWNDLANSNVYEQSGYICEWEASDVAEETQVEGYTGHLYEFYTLPESEWESGPITWQQAERRCEWKGGHLAVIESSTENFLLYSAMKAKGYENAYFGYSDKSSEGNWKWVNGTSTAYTNWHSGEPNNQDGIEHYAMVALLKSGRINNRLLCELATHKDFIKFLADIEIYVDGIATMQIQNLNALVDTVRHEIIERYRPGEDDPHLKVLQAAHISDDEYFSHMVLDDLNLIIRDIREAHKKDSESAPQTTVANELKENLEAVENFKGSRDEKLVVLYCKQLGINYKNLSDEEFRWLIRILKKSKKMGTPISQRKKR